MQHMAVQRSESTPSEPIPRSGWLSAPPSTMNLRSRGGSRIARVAGIDIYVHWTFAVLLVWSFGSQVLGGHGARVAAVATLFLMAVFACVVLHELGHALVARWFGIRTRDITLYPIGGVARLERIPERPVAELWVALAGPAVNMIIAGVLGAVFGLVALRSSLAQGLAHGSFVAKLLVVNVYLAAFNLLPAFPMDGGRALRALLAMRLDYLKATQIAATAGQSLAVVFGLLGLFFNPFLLFIALFVFTGAQQEAQATLVRSLLSRVPVRQAMATQFSPISSRASLARAAEAFVSTRQRDFPVVGDGRVLGILTRDDLVRAMALGRLDVPVTAVMVPACGTVHPGDMLDSVFAKMQSAECKTALVVDEGTLVGLLSAEDIGEWLMLHASIGAREKAGPRPIGSRPSFGSV
jgi:Zn-dependent protease/CBS domain-containing protein